MELLEALAVDDVKLVLIEKLDRLACDLLVQETIIGDLHKRGYQLISVTAVVVRAEHRGISIGPTPALLLRAHDAIFGDEFRRQVRDMGTREVLSVRRSRWQRACVEGVIGSIRQGCLDHPIVFNDVSLRRTLHSYFEY